MPLFVSLLALFDDLHGPSQGRAGDPDLHFSRDARRSGDCGTRREQRGFPRLFADRPQSHFERWLDSCLRGNDRAVGERSVIDHGVGFPVGFSLWLIPCRAVGRLPRRCAPPKKIDFARNAMDRRKYWNYRRLQTNAMRRPFSSRHQPRSGLAIRNDIKGGGRVTFRGRGRGRAGRWG